MTLIKNFSFKKLCILIYFYKLNIINIKCNGIQILNEISRQLKDW